MTAAESRLIPCVTLVFCCLVVGGAAARGIEAQVREPANRIPASSSPLALAAIFDEQILADNVLAVRERAAALPDAKRFEYLAKWVLPCESHVTIRTSGTFSQTDPVPRHGGADTLNEASGGTLKSPVFDLVDVAERTGRLQQLLTTVEAIRPSSNEEQQRARAAMLVLINLQMGRQEAAAVACQRLVSLVQQDTPVGMADQWPETLVAWRNIVTVGDPAIVNDLIAFLLTRRTFPKQRRGMTTWHNQIASLAGRHTLLAVGGSREDLSASTGLSQWIPVGRARSLTRGHGYPAAYWRWQTNRVDNISAHDDEYLFFRSPLTGNYEIECDLTAPGLARAHVMVAGTFSGPSNDLRNIETGTFRTDGGLKPVDLPFSRLDAWVHYRCVVRDHVCRTYINGRPVQTTSLTNNHDPWVAIRSRVRSHGGVRDVRITGDPVIPESVALSASPELTGWFPYFEEAIAREGARWRHADDPDSDGLIIGRRGANLAGTSSESLLRYQRPLEEDGNIDYDFFYRPARFETHPALDRLVFMLQPDGVRLHWITDSPFDPTEIAPDNLIDEPANRRGPVDLPLKPDAWNHLTLAISGSQVTVNLNGQLVFERELEASNRRTFGFFHYADNTEVRARNVTLRGNWPRTLPTIAEQELAGETVDILDKRLPELTSVFEHNFAADEVPTEYFRTRTSVGAVAQMQPRSDGLYSTVTAAGDGGGTDLLVRFEVDGDFDVEAGFEQLSLTGNDHASIVLGVQLSDEQPQICHLARVKDQGQRQAVSAAAAEMHEGQRHYVTIGNPTCEASSGRLRLARRGHELFYLFAEGDSSVFRFIGQATVTAAKTTPEGIMLRVLAAGTSSSSVVWKHIRVRAEKLR